jgi:hypothetical protein
MFAAQAHRLGRFRIRPLALRIAAAKIRGAMPRFRTVREIILTARDAQGVERALEDALARLAPEEIAALPRDCREAVLDRRADLHAAAVTLLQCDLKYRGDRDIGELVRQLAELFASASVRLSQIEHRLPAGSGEP